MRGNTTGYYASAIGGCEAPLLRRYLSGDTLKATIEGFSSGVKKLYSDVKVDENYGDKFGPTGSLSTWFDFMVTDDGSSLTSSGITKDACDMSAEEDLHLAESAPRTRKVQKLASKDCIHGLHDLDMDVMMPYIMDDKRKRRYLNLFMPAVDKYVVDWPWLTPWLPWGVPVCKSFHCMSEEN
jgi:hypothetical protein